MAESATKPTYEQLDIYECPACSEVYANGHDASDCCRPATIEGYVCLACGTAHRTEQQAAACLYCDGRRKCECVHVKRRHFNLERLQSCYVEDCRCSEFKEAVTP